MGSRHVLLGILAPGLLAACSSKDASINDSAAGTVTIDGTTGDVVFRGVEYPLTSDNFKKFSVAQEALDALPQLPVVQRIDVRNPREDDVVLVVKQLEDDDAARKAIESAGMSVRDFVLTSLALGQALAFSTDSRMPVDDVNRAFLDSNRLVVARIEARRLFRVEDADQFRTRINRAGDDDEDADDEVRKDGRGRGRSDGDGKRKKKGRGHNKH